MLKLLILLVLTSAGPWKTYDVFVSDCYDGDTCTVNFHLGLGIVLKDQKVRLYGIDTPEIRPLTTREAATKSRDRLLELIRRAIKVQAKVLQKETCTNHPAACDKKGKYGRWLVEIYADTVNLNQLLVKEGLAEYKSY